MLPKLRAWCMHGLWSCVNISSSWGGVINRFVTVRRILAEAYCDGSWLYTSMFVDWFGIQSVQKRILSASSSATDRRFSIDRAYMELMRQLGFKAVCDLDTIRTWGEIKRQQVLSMVRAIRKAGLLRSCNKITHPYWSSLRTSIYNRDFLAVQVLGTCIANPGMTNRMNQARCNFMLHPCLMIWLFPTGS